MASGAYTVTKMLESINSVMAPVATTPNASVSLKRKLDNGVMLDTSPREIALLDLQAKVKHAAQQVAAIEASGGDKRQWVGDKRLAGNDAFRDGHFQQASEMYVEALAGLDLGGSPEQRRACQLREQLPLTCNLAACLLMMEQWEKARQVCEQALRIDPKYVRALGQRAKALSRLGRFSEARSDIQRAIEDAANEKVQVAEVGANVALAKFHKQQQDIERAAQRDRVRFVQRRQFHKQMMREAVGRLYEDKEVVAKPADAASHEGEDEEKRPLSQALVAPTPAISRRVIQWLACLLLVVLEFLFGKLEKRA